MATEKYIRDKAIKILKDKKWVYWYPPKIKFKQNDIFGIIDLLAVKGKIMKKIQLTTISNVSSRRKKIICFLRKFKVELPVEIWAWNSRKKEFKKERINIKIEEA